MLAPRGTVHSYTVVHYAANRALADAVPYTVVLVSLDDAPHLRVVGNIDGPVHIGMAVVPYWEERTADDGTVVLLPQWRAASRVSVDDLELRPVEPGDYEYVIPRVDHWWGGRKMAALLPRLFFEHFAPTTAIAVDAGTHGIVGFVCGFVSQTDPDIAYIHFVGVDPELAARASAAPSTSGSSPEPSNRAAHA